MSAKEKQQKEQFRTALLEWYTAHQRRLPWRLDKREHGCNALPDPYHVWLSEIMLQQTVVAAVIPYFLKFTKIWPTVFDLANASEEDVMREWAGLGYYARARNLHKCAKIVAFEKNGIFPDTEEALRKLPGIGDYTSAAIAAIAFDKEANVVDGNVERVMSRLYAIKTPLPDSKPALKRRAGALTTHKQAGCYAQALMDLGATICTPKSPKCMICPVSEFCKARSEGFAADLPYKKKKAAKPKRTGFIYWIENEEQQILLETRPEKGLLGNMAAFPTVGWETAQQGAAHPDWLQSDKWIKDKGIKIFHSFTHFDLELQGYRASVNQAFININDNCYWVDKNDIINIGLPTVFLKFAKMKLAQ